MKRKIIIGISIIIIVALAISIVATLTAGKSKWAVIRTNDNRIILESEAERAVKFRWEYYVWDPMKKKPLLTYAESVIQSGETLIMPRTDNIYLKISSSKLKLVEKERILITK